MKKNNTHSLVSIFVVLAIFFALGTTMSTISQKSETKKVALDTKNKSTKDKIYAYNLPEATFTVSSFSLAITLVFLFSLVFIPVKKALAFIDLVPRVEISYWSKLFTSTIVVNAP